VSRYTPRQRIKYYLLAGLLAAAVLGTLQIGLLDPICIMYRSLTGSVLPTVQQPLLTVLSGRRFYQGAWLIGLVFFFLVVVNFAYPRFFCRVLCPLGALLGVLSRFAWWRVERDPDKCTDCEECLVRCEAACDPHTSLRKAECFVCFNCIEDCPEGALSFARFPSGRREVIGTDTSRRKLLFAAITGALFYPLMRVSGRSGRDFSSKVIRPPGACEELEFLERCIKCDQCIRVCPTNVLQPDWFESGLEGLWSPILNFRMGYCQMHCTMCGEVCPTGAIQRLSVDEKLGLQECADQGPVRLGLAHFDVGRCLPHSKGIPCAVCEEVCPTSPKAIYTERRSRTVRGGRKLVVGATGGRVTLGEVEGGSSGKPGCCSFDEDQFKGEGTTAYHISVQHADGLVERRRIIGNSADAVQIEGVFARTPELHAAVEIEKELSVPVLDAERCIGCGICEYSCPIVGDRRAIYVMAGGETRSANHPDPDRNRSVRPGTK